MLLVHKIACKICSSYYLIYLEAVNNTYCPVNYDFKPGGYGYCGKGCLNQNKHYPDLETAWEECGKNPKCKRIMKFAPGGGKFFLRESTDYFYQANDTDCLNCTYVEYYCKGKIPHQSPMYQLGR